MAEKKGKKKAAVKKAEPKAEAPVTLPPNPKRNYGAAVRRMTTDLKTAAGLITKFGFRTINREGDKVMLIADSTANRAYEESK